MAYAYYLFSSSISSIEGFPIFGLESDHFLIYEFIPSIFFI